MCPFCGLERSGGGGAVCEGCGVEDTPIARRRAQNAMGPWFVRGGGSGGGGAEAASVPRSFAWVVGEIDAGRVVAESVVRGPTTGQLWRFARSVPGVAVYVGRCHGCGALADRVEAVCPSCGADLHPAHEREDLGLGPVNPLPGEADAAEVARRALGASVVSGAAAGASAAAVASGAARDGGVEMPARVERRAGVRPEEPAAPVVRTKAAAPGGDTVDRGGAAAWVVGVVAFASAVIGLGLGSGLMVAVWDGSGGAARHGEERRLAAEEGPAVEGPAVVEGAGAADPAGLGVGGVGADSVGGASVGGAASSALAGVDGVGVADDAGGARAERSLKGGDVLPDADGGAPVLGSDSGPSGAGMPLDRAIERYRARVEAALASSRGDDVEALAGAVAELEAVRAEALRGGARERDVVLLEHYLSERRSRLARLRLGALLGLDG